jgi:asparagine synthase (glutamine-hydrolysing)
MQVGFAIVLHGEQAEFQFFGQRPGAARSLMAHAQHGPIHVVLMGRLTYRSDLVEELPPEMHGTALANDAALALAAYRHWGPGGLTRLEGCFALAVWDGDNKLLLGSRDPLGGYPLFWTRHQGGLAFGTCLGPLLQLLPGRALNLDYLAEYLALPGAMYQEVPTPQCVYEGIYRVGPGSVVQGRLSDGQVQEQRYWDWLERMFDPGTERLEELSELVADGLRRAVREQLRGRVASHFSGGMDSTAVALLARDALRERPGQPPVHAISLVYERLGELSRETPYLETALEQPDLVPHRIRADDLVDFDCFTDPPLHDEPFGALCRLGMQGKLAEAAAAVGADTLLTGVGAEASVDQVPYHLADWLGRGRLWAAWRDARARGRAGNRSAWSYLWTFGLLPRLPAAWRAGLGSFWRGGHTGWRQQGPGTIAPWIQPDFARTHGLRGRALGHLSLPGRSVKLGMVLSLLRAGIGDCTNWYAAAPLGLTQVNPFLDARFLRLGLGIQARFLQQPGQQKPLLAYAMRDVLPESILKRRRKGHFNSVTHSGLARNRPALEALIRQAPVDSLGVFDKKVLLSCLQQAALGLAPGDAMGKLHLSLAWLCWHSFQDQWQQPMMPVQRLLPATARMTNHCSLLQTRFANSKELALGGIS